MDNVEIAHLPESQLESRLSANPRWNSIKTNEDGQLVCPNGNTFYFAYRKPVKGNQYGRQEEYYTCEDCIGV